jgi:hypothetical protein
MSLGPFFCRVLTSHCFHEQEDFRNYIYALFDPSSYEEDDSTPTAAKGRATKASGAASAASDAGSQADKAKSPFATPPSSTPNTNPTSAGSPYIGLASSRAAAAAAAAAAVVHADTAELDLDLFLCCCLEYYQQQCNSQVDTLCQLLGLFDNAESEDAEGGDTTELNARGGSKRPKVNSSAEVNQQSSDVSSVNRPRPSLTTRRVLSGDGPRPSISAAAAGQSGGPLGAMMGEGLDSSALLVEVNFDAFLSVVRQMRPGIDVHIALVVFRKFSRYAPSFTY